MSETLVTQPLPNDPAARTPTGEIKNVTPPPTNQPETPTPSLKPADAPAAEPAKPAEPKAEPKADPEGTSLLNERNANDPTKVPEAYEFKMPDGYEMDETVGKEVTTLFKEIGLDQPSAQKLLDFYVAKASDAAEAPYRLWAETQKEWVNQIKADADLGGRLSEVKVTVAKAIDGLGDPKLAQEFRQAMDITGAGNNPAFVKTFWKLAQMVTEPGHVSGRGPSAEGQKGPDDRPRSAANALYPNLPS
jgi:hypothetical protein